MVRQHREQTDTAAGTRILQVACSNRFRPTCAGVARRCRPRQGSLQARAGQHRNDHAAQGQDSSHGCATTTGRRHPAAPVGLLARVEAHQAPMGAVAG
eukprot:12150605-Alexandrium_andersonii.AAC.1